LNLEGDSELLREFVSESHEHLQNIELGVLTLEENPTDADTLNSIFRAFHTFKGGSGFLNLTPINRLAHELESLLDLARQNKLTIDSEITNIILNGGDTLNRFVQAIQAQLSGVAPHQPVLIPTRSLLNRINAVLKQDAATLTSTGTAGSHPTLTTPSPSAVQVDPQPDTSISAGSTSLDTAKTASANSATIKVDTDKLDGLVDLVGEMVIAQSMVAQDPNLLSLQSQQLSRNLAQLTRITRDLQRVSMSLRMVPIRALFRKMNRVVRDLAVKAGKQVQLRLEGEETELDRTIVEELNDPLVHMIRNSMDHGIEKAEDRLAAGKPPYGTITLRAFHQGGNIVIELGDDGAGLNRDRILQKAVERGLARPGEELSEKEVFGFIFGAGFSTAEKVTDISGRGVGMDVVRRNIEKLRGKIEVDSAPGSGTSISIHLPLTLAIIDGLIVTVAGERYVVPTLSVRESLRPTTAMISTIHERGELVNVRGNLIPLLRLHEIFDRPGAITDPAQGIILVVESDLRARCLLVDELSGKQEVVIKGLGDGLLRSPGLAGGAILGDGRVGLILDIAGLIEVSGRLTAQAA
jgi:two-component system chemotaxis sensor kinase CheA